MENDKSLVVAVPSALLGIEPLGNVARSLKVGAPVSGGDLGWVAGHTVAHAVVVGVAAKLAGASPRASVGIGAATALGLEALLFAWLYQGSPSANGVVAR